MSYKETKNRGTFDFPVEIYHLDESHPRYIMDHHWHFENEIIRILEGELAVTLHQTKYIAKKGDIVFVNSSILHSAIPRNCIYECVVFDMSFLAKENGTCQSYVEQLTNTTVMIYEHLRPQDNRTLHQTVWGLFDVLFEKKEAYEALAIGMLYQMIGLIFGSGFYQTNPLLGRSHTRKNIRNFKKVLMHIQEAYDTPITLKELSDIAEMSPKYFCWYFKTMTCKSPMEYVNYYRIECAASKIRNTDLPITEIAFSCGFNDLSYFIKTFKRYKQTTPGKFRAKTG